MWCFVCSAPGLVEFLTQNSKNNFSAQLNAVILAKCFRAKLWEDSPYISKQLDRIGTEISLETLYRIELRMDGGISKWIDRETEN